MNREGGVLLGAVITIAGLLVVVINDRQKRRVVLQAEREGRTAPKRYLNFETRWGAVLAMVVGVPLLLLVARHKPAWLIRLSVAAPLSVVGLVVFTILVVGAFRRIRDRVVFQTLRQAESGDVEGAITVLREHIRTHPNSLAALTALSGLLGQLQRWADALNVIQQAEAVNPKHPVVVNNKGTILWKLGRTDEALSSLQDAVQRDTQSLLALCNCGSLLAEMGRLDEAKRLLDQAERLAAQHFVFPASQRQVQQQLLDSFRERLRQGPPA